MAQRNKQPRGSTVRIVKPKKRHGLTLPRNRVISRPNSPERMETKEPKGKKGRERL